MSKMQETSPRTVADLLPVELFFTIIPLTRPSSSIPLASRLLATLLDFPPSTAKSDSSKSMCFDWIRRSLLESTDWTCAGFLQGGPVQPSNVRVPCLCLCCFLVELRPTAYWFPTPDPLDSCQGLLPERFKAALCDTWVMRHSFVDWMVGRFGDLDEAGVKSDLSLLELSTSVEKVGARYLPDSPIVDMMLLAIFYMRSSNADLLYFALLNLTFSFPILLDFELPLNHWSQLSEAMDDPYIAGQLFLDPRSSRVFPTPMSHYFLTLAALQWSVPLTSTICDVFDFEPAYYLEWPLFRLNIFDEMIDTLDCLPRYLSPAPMCRWLHANGFEPDSEEHASIAYAATTKSHFLDLFFAHDERNLDLISRRSWAHQRLYSRCEDFRYVRLLRDYGLTNFDSQEPPSEEEMWSGAWSW